MNHFIKKHSSLALAAVLVAVLPTAAQQDGQYAEIIEVFEDFVEKQMEIDRIPGLSIGFVKDDFIWTKGFGFADLENNTPASANTAYRLASNAKSMTAVAILQLVEQGKVDLDAEVQTYVPYFPRKRWPVTVRQLLGHLGGISHYRDYDIEGHIKEHKDTGDALAIFSEFDLVAEPGTKYNYSSYGYNLLGAVIEGAAKQPYGDFLRENLWEPLGMNNTYMDDPNEIIPNRVQGYRLVDGELINSEFIDISSRFAAGGTISTVVDLLKYAEGLNSEKVLSQKGIDLMQTPMVTKGGYFSDYGMGWRITPVNGRFQVHHTGSQAETRTLLVRFPKENLAIALAYNLEGADRHVYAQRLAQLLLDEPWNIGVYTGNKVDDAIFRGLADIYNYGLSYFDRYQKPVTTDRKELAEAFNYLNTALNQASLASNYTAIVKKIKDGRHPVAEQAFVKVGSYIAQELQTKHGADHMEIYHKIGVIRFFHDYLTICSLRPDHPAELKLSENVGNIVVKWHRDWEKTYTDYTRRLSITPNSDLKKVGRELKRTFSRAEIYPDFTQDLAGVTEYFYVIGDRKMAYEAANLALDLYPDAPLPLVLLANTQVCFGEKDKGREMYNKALEVNADDWVIGAESLDRYAANLVASGKLDEALELLKIALELYPQEARLYTSVAEIHLKRGKDYYQKAVEVDPTFEPARKGLKKFK